MILALLKHCIGESYALAFFGHDRPTGALRAFYTEMGQRVAQHTGGIALPPTPYPISIHAQELKSFYLKNQQQVLA